MIFEKKKKGGKRPCYWVYLVLLLIPIESFAQVTAQQLMGAGMPVEQAVLVSSILGSPNEVLFSTNRMQIKTSGNPFFIGTDDAAGSDDSSVSISGGGGTGADNTRGAYLILEGEEAGGRMQLGAGGPTADLLFQTANATRWTMDETGQFIGAGTATIGWAVVDGTDNTACSSQCTAPAVFGFDLAGGATAPVLVGPAGATADICLCAGAS